MKVVEYLHTAEGGHMVYTKELAAGLRAAGADVHVLAGVGADPDSGVLPLVPTPDTTLPAGPQWLRDRVSVYTRQTRAVLAVLDKLHEPGATWLHCQQLPTLRPRVFVRSVQRAGWQVCVTVHNVTPHSSDVVTRALHQAQMRAWAEADLLLVHSERLRRQLLDVLGAVAPERVAVAPHPVWAEQEPVDVEPSKDFLFFGHLRPNKGIEYFVRALSEAGDPPATIAGSGSVERVQAIRDQIESLGLTNVDFRPGFVADEEVPALFAQHRVVVTPYVGFDAQSGVTHLAVAHDRPIVVTDVGALSDLVDEFGLGAVVGQGESLAESMRIARTGAVQGTYQQGLAAARERLAPASVGHILREALRGVDRA